MRVRMEERREEENNIPRPGTMKKTMAPETIIKERLPLSNLEKDERAGETGRKGVITGRARPSGLWRKENEKRAEGKEERDGREVSECLTSMKRLGGRGWKRGRERSSIYLAHAAEIRT